MFQLCNRASSSGNIFTVDLYRRDNDGVVDDEEVVGDDVVDNGIRRRKDNGVVVEWS